MSHCGSGQLEATARKWFLPSKRYDLLSKSKNVYIKQGGVAVTPSYQRSLAFTLSDFLSFQTLEVFFCVFVFPDEIK